ncbi:outer membrane protein [Donghicola sp. XS_ASV15]|uniref:outer membrane protein n=1 Tax=Donghicola sp. XS_ASV15 TaxID=3241295 RepID=UPI003512AA6E
MAIKTAALTSIIALSAAPVLAGSLTPPPTEPAPVVVSEPVAVDGNWTGFYGGIQAGGGKVTTDEGAVDLDGNGGLGGVHLGYDYDFGKYVLGAGVEYDAGNIELDDNADALQDVTRLKLKAGYDMGQGLPYLTAGAAAANFEEAGYNEGGFVGLGYEHKVTDSVTVGGEVLRHRFIDMDDTNMDADATTAQVRMSYRF